MIGMKRARLSATALGVTLGLMCGVWMLVVGLLATYYDVGFAKDMMTRWEGWFPGVQVTLIGSLTVGAWGLLKGFVTGLVFGWIYNLCLCCCTRCCPCCKCSCCGGKCNCGSSTCNVCNPAQKM
ncbi:MAG: hypothetical protein SFW66_07425 [Gammaproteobacteria bacterium]|nr:hypothetical protein [Gammaproteobacteria bacterium]